MDERALTGLLNELHAKLKSANAITERDRELLARLSVDIQSLLAHPGGLAAAKHRSVIDGLRESIAHFEVTHPDLTDVIARVSKMLADMGI
jgi:hypothetical protein